MNDLTIACITKVEAFAPPFLLAMQDAARNLDAEFLIGADGEDAVLRANAQLQQARVVRVNSRGFLESVHDDLIRHCTTSYVLRLDDDEKMSPAMLDWLMDRAYRTSDHWKFPRANMWTPTTFLRSSHLWPDHQTRLSVQTKALGRTHLHAGSPHGGGRPAPVAIEHYKFVVKTREERLQIAHRYDEIQGGCGTGGMLPFNLPEDFYTDLPIEGWGDGLVG